MSKYIDAYKFLEENEGAENSGWTLRELIENFPTADVRENVRGKWIYHKNDMSCVRWDKWECSACHNKQENKTNFCSNCGADMQKGEKDACK